MNLKCLWCTKTEPDICFQKKAHTIPKSLGGQNYNYNICDDCNSYFGNKQENNYSIEEALKETFNITRRRLIHSVKTKKKVGDFKSRFFEIKERKGRTRLSIKPSFRLDSEFQIALCRSFKRGLYKMCLEELNRQRKIGFEEKYNIIRRFARYNEGDLPVFYFNRSFGALMMFEKEAETPIIYFDRMKYLYCNEKFIEIEFLGHVFGFPITEVTTIDIKDYLNASIQKKKELFLDVILITKLTQIDFTLKIMDK